MIKPKKMSASLEDYLETISEIADENGVARHKEIKSRLAVSSPSITEACQQLSERGLIRYAPYAPISLTEQGEKVAREIIFRHNSLKNFFIEVLGVDVETADDGACKMEHVVSEIIVERMIKYTHFIKEKRENKVREIEFLIEQLKA